MNKYHIHSLSVAGNLFNKMQSLNMITFITGRPIAQNCYNGNVSFLLNKMENLNLCNMESLV